MAESEKKNERKYSTSCWKFRERWRAWKSCRVEHRASTWCSGFSIFYHTTSSCGCKGSLGCGRNMNSCEEIWKYENLRHRRTNSHTEPRSSLWMTAIYTGYIWSEMRNEEREKLKLLFTCTNSSGSMTNTHMRLTRTRTRIFVWIMFTEEKWENCELTILHVPLLWSSCFLPRSCLAHNFRDFMAFLSLRAATRDNCKEKSFFNDTLWVNSTSDTFEYSTGSFSLN